jgi:hypothetical protein
MDTGGENAGYSTMNRSKPGDENLGESRPTCFTKKTLATNNKNQLNRGRGRDEDGDANGMWRHDICDRGRWDEGCDAIICGYFICMGSTLFCGLWGSRHADFRIFSNQHLIPFRVILMPGAPTGQESTPALASGYEYLFPIQEAPV